MKAVWSQEETEYLVKNYELTKTPILLSVLKNKTNDQLRWKAKEFKLKKRVSRTKTDCSFLEDFDDAESLYWWGFLTADGCFTEKQIIFSLEEKDSEYVEKFAKMCGSRVALVTRNNPWHKAPYTMARTVVNDKFIIPRLAKRLKIVPQKTYNPFDLSEFLTEPRLIYFLAGLIDGDGHISQRAGDYQIRIKVHYNWHKQFNLISSKINEFYSVSSSSYVSSQGWAILSISRKADIQNLKRKLSNSVPLMARKWDIVDEYV